MFNPNFVLLTYGQFISNATHSFALNFQSVHLFVLYHLHNLFQPYNLLRALSSASSGRCLMVEQRVMNQSPELRNSLPHHLHLSILIKNIITQFNYQT